MLFREGSAVLHANRRRNVQFRNRLLHHLHSGAEAYAFEAASHRNIPLQVLAANFGLAGFVLKLGQRTE